MENKKKELAGEDEVNQKKASVQLMTNMKKILATNRSMKAKGKAKKSSGIQFVELRRSAETGKRIYKPKRQRSQKKKESKKRCIGSDDSTSQVTKTTSTAIQ
ncbi:uncharacterized protein [Clytia hemisphaerica]|uniref:uncharacterized protein n=1 Tax=Clytia hemisphaerica TaxID=252671 RepID=UPI0034D4EB53